MRVTTCSVLSLQKNNSDKVRRQNSEAMLKRRLTFRWGNRPCAIYPLKGRILTLSISEPVPPPQLPALPFLLFPPVPLKFREALYGEAEGLLSFQ
jgi:hypothetical protein